MTPTATPAQGGVSAADAAVPTYVGRWVSARIGTDFLTVVDARTHGILADEPIPLGGADLGMTPYELLLASVAGARGVTRIELTGALSTGQHERLVQIADRCPIKRNPKAGLEVISMPRDVP